MVLSNSAFDAVEYHQVVSPFHCHLLSSIRWYQMIFTWWQRHVCANNMPKVIKQSRICSLQYLPYFLDHKSLLCIRCSDAKWQDVCKIYKYVTLADMSHPYTDGQTHISTCSIGSRYIGMAIISKYLLQNNLVLLKLNFLQFWNKRVFYIRFSNFEIKGLNVCCLL